MLEVNALVSGTPWSRTSRRLAGMLKRTVSWDRLSGTESVSDMGGSTKKAVSSSSQASVFGRSSSSVGDSRGVKSDEVGRPSNSNWSERLSSGVRRLLGPSTPDRLHSKAISDSMLDTTGQRGSSLASFSDSRSRSSSALPAASTGNGEGDRRVPSELEGAAAEGWGRPGETPRRKPPSIRALSSPRWRRGVAVSPSDRSEGGTDGP